MAYNLRYRLFINDDLLTERDWIWGDSAIIEEEIWVDTDLLDDQIEFRLEQKDYFTNNELRYVYCQQPFLEKFKRKSVTEEIENLKTIFFGDYTVDEPPLVPPLDFDNLRVLSPELYFQLSDLKIQDMPKRMDNLKLFCDRMIFDCKIR